MWCHWYRWMEALPGSRSRRFLWWLLRKLRIHKRWDDEGLVKIRLLAVTGERFRTPEEGGGVNSAYIRQMLNWKSDIPRICCDKWAVRQFVRDRGCERYLVPLVPDERCWTDPAEIDFKALPRAFVLKCNNGSGMLKIVRDKTFLDEDATRRELGRWLKNDYAAKGGERQYAGMARKIVCEQLIETPSGEVPSDYKIVCSNGRPLFAWVDTGRFVKHLRTVFDTDFNRLDVSIGFPVDPKPIARPEKWDEMLALASRLSAGIPIVRVDLYCVSGKVYFGEMTFTSDRMAAETRPFAFSNEQAHKIDFMGI